MPQHPPGDGPNRRPLILAGSALILLAALVGFLLLTNDGQDSVTPDPTGTPSESTTTTAAAAGPLLDRFGPAVVAEWLGDDVPLLDDAFVGVSFLTALSAGAPPAEAVELCQRAVSADQIAAEVPVLVFDIDGNLVADGGGELGPCEAVDPDDAPLDADPGDSG
jgi:hypothetical protein